MFILNANYRTVIDGWLLAFPGRKNAKEKPMAKRAPFLLATVAVMLAHAGAGAVTIDPTDFDVILTENGRTTTIDGADVSGHAAIAGNGDIRLLKFPNMRPGQKALFVGSVTSGGGDRFFNRHVTGLLEASVLNFAARDDNGGGAFSTLFKMFIGGVLMQTLDLSGDGDDLVENATFTSMQLDNQHVELMAHGTGGITLFDMMIGIAPAAEAPIQLLAPPQNVVATPIPLGLPLMASVLAGGWMLQRRIGDAGRGCKQDS